MMMMMMMMMTMMTKNDRLHRVLQHVQKVKTPKQDSTVFSFLYFFFALINSLTLSPQSFTPHHLLLL